MFSSETSFDADLDDEDLIIHLNNDCVFSAGVHGCISETSDDADLDDEDLDYILNLAMAFRGYDSETSVYANLGMRT
jgi:hypothetical protein